MVIYTKRLDTFLVSHWPQCSSLVTMVYAKGIKQDYFPYHRNTCIPKSWVMKSKSNQSPDIVVNTVKEVLDSTHTLSGSALYKQKIFKAECDSEDDVSPSIEDEVGDFQEGFSKLPYPCTWDLGELTYTILLYECLVHIPFGVGGLSIASLLLQKDVGVDTEAQGAAFLGFGILELLGTVLLLSSSLQPYQPLPPSWFKFRFTSIFGKRGLLISVVLGLIATVTLVASIHWTLFLLISLQDSVDLEKPGAHVAALISASVTSKCASFLAFCLIVPLQEEIIYRGYLLPCLATKMPMPGAIALSACIFAISHPSGNILELWSIGCCLGLVYSWTGNLLSSLLVHSMYNSMIVASSWISMN